jgi:hypothetical protein
MSDADKRRMKRSLAEFGDLSGIVINRRTGNLVGGHQRADVLQSGQLVVTDLPAPEADGTVARGHLEHDGKKYNVRVVDWTDIKAQAAMLAANRFSRVGKDDPDMLGSLMEDLVNANFDLDLTGFDEEAVAGIRGGDEGGRPQAESVEGQSVWGVRILCESETEQRELFERLTAEGLSCETLM